MRRKSHWFTDDRLHLVYPVFFQGKLTGVVYLQSDLGGLYERLGRFVEIGIGVLVASLLMALFVSLASREGHQQTGSRPGGNSANRHAGQGLFHSRPADQPPR